MISNLTIDTNILVYSIDSRDQTNHQVAVRIVAACQKARRPIALQALNEFFRTVTKKGLLPIGEAIAVVNDARAAMKLTAANEDDLVHAMASHQRYKL